MTQSRSIYKTAIKAVWYKKYIYFIYFGIQVVFKSKGNNRIIVISLLRTRISTNQCFAVAVTFSNNPLSVELCISKWRQKSTKVANGGLATQPVHKHTHSVDITFQFIHFIFQSECNGVPGGQVSGTCAQGFGTCCIIVCYVF